MKKHILAIIILAMVLAMASAGKVQASYSEKSREEAIPSKPFFTRQVGDLVNADIKDACLREVLAQVSREYGIRFLLPYTLAEEKVMVRFSNLPLEEGLAKILQNYNTIFIYYDEKLPSSESSTRLKEVRVYPLSAGKGKVEMLTIVPGNSELVMREIQLPEKDKEKVQEAKKGKRSIDELTSDLSSNFSQVRKEAVNALSKLSNEKTIAPLALALKDEDDEVKKRAREKLKEVGESLKEWDTQRQREEQEAKGDESQTGAQEEDETTPPDDKAKSELTLDSNAGTSANVELENAVPVRGVQFTLNGAKPVEVRTTSRSEGFFAEFNKSNGTVLLVSFSGDTIAPGTGPVAEIVCNNGGTHSISDVKIVEECNNKKKK